VETAITHNISNSPLWDEIMSDPEAAIQAVQRESSRPGKELEIAEEEKEEIVDIAEDAVESRGVSGSLGSNGGAHNKGSRRIGEPAGVTGHLSGVNEDGGDDTMGSGDQQGHSGGLRWGGRGYS
jgi:hypothetical protein